MTTPKDVITRLEEAIKVVQSFDTHLQHLVNEVATLRPTHDAMKVLLQKVGYAKEQAIEDNLKLLIDEYSRLVAENTKLKGTLDDQEALMEQLRKVVVKSAD